MPTNDMASVSVSRYYLIRFTAFISHFETLYDIYVICMVGKNIITIIVVVVVVAVFVIVTVT